MATANQFYNGLSSFPEIDFSPLLQLLALAYTPFASTPVFLPLLLCHGRALNFQQGL